MAESDRVTAPYALDSSAVEVTPIWTAERNRFGFETSLHAMPDFGSAAATLHRRFPDARFVETDAFGSVGLGLALDARRKFG